MYPKHPDKPLTDWLRKVRHQSFPMRYYMTLYLKSQGAAKLQAVKVGGQKANRKSNFHRITAMKFRLHTIADI